MEVAEEAAEAEVEDEEEANRGFVTYTKWENSTFDTMACSADVVSMHASLKGHPGL